MESTPQVPSRFGLRGITFAVKSFLSKAAISGSGCDSDVLQQHGSAQCRSKAAAVGYVNLAASSFGGIGAFAKTFMLVSGPLALPLACIVGTLYFTIVFNLERMLAASINAFWTPKTKLQAFLSRLSISSITASFQAAPVILLALGTQVDARLTRFELEAREQAKVTLEKLHGVSAIDQQTINLMKVAQNAAQQVWVLPEAVVDAQQLADKCDKDAEALLNTNRRKAASLQARLPALSNIELSNSATPAQKAAAKRDRDDIAGRVNRLADEVVTKRGECKTEHVQAADAKNRYLADATGKREKADADLDQQKRAAQEVSKVLKADIERANEAAKKGNAVNSAAEVKAAVALISEEPFARLKALWIFLGFIVVDIAGVALKLLAKPGPYDHALRKRDELARIGANQTVREAEREDLEQEVASAAKLKGTTTFHHQDGGAVFARLEQLRFDEQVRTTETVQDIRIAKSQMLEIDALGMAVEQTIQRVEGSPALVARLNEVLAILRGTATSGSAA